MIIALAGFMGSGKTSVGRALAPMLGLPLTDLDAVVESREGKDIPSIFAEGGEAAFRKAEKEALAYVLSSGADMVLSLGGGTLTDPSNAALVKGKCLCIYLKASAEGIMESLGGNPGGRPMLKGGDMAAKVSSLLAARLPAYEAAADITVESDGRAPEDIALEIRKLI